MQVLGTGREWFRDAAEDYLAHRLDPQRELTAGAQLKGTPLMELKSQYDGFSADRVTMGAPHTTSDFSTLLVGCVQRVLSDRYEVARPAIAQASRQMSLPDFRKVTAVRLSSGSELTKVPEAGEVTYGTFKEEGEKIQLATFAKIFALSRHALVNDDLGAFSGVPTKMAEGATLTVRTSICALLTANSGAGVTMRDGTPLFDSSHGNVAASGGRTFGDHPQCGNDRDAAPGRPER